MKVKKIVIAYDAEDFITLKKKRKKLEAEKKKLLRNVPKKFEEKF